MGPLPAIRAAVASLSDDELLAVIASIEDDARRGRPDRVVYAVACVAMCARLGVDCDEVSRSSLGPAEYLRLTWEFRAV